MEQKCILIVDDDTELREAIAGSLGAEGYIVDTATDGAEGLQKALDTHPDLILLDIGMPKMNGHEVLAKLRRDSWGKTANVLLLTNFDDATNIAQGVELKSDDYLIKSGTDLKTIAAKVKQHLAGYHD